MTPERLTDAQLEAIHAVSAELFAEAVSQGMQASFSLDCDYWGREYADRLTAVLRTDQP